MYVWFACIYVCHIRMYVCTFVCMYVCMYMCLLVSGSQSPIIYVCIYIYIYIYILDFIRTEKRCPENVYMLHDASSHATIIHTRNKLIQALAEAISIDSELDINVRLSG